MRVFIISLLLMAIVAVPALAGDRNVDGSTVTLLSPLGTIDGDSAILEFEIFNNTWDYEWHQSTTITLPECMVITALGYYHDPLYGSYDYTTEGVGTNEAYIYNTWMTVDGLLQGGQTMMFYVTVDVSNCDVPDLCYEWDFVGDMYGDEPHVVGGVECTGVVATEDATWDSVKSLYR